MKLHEELHEASVAATGHHADLLRRAADYVAACEGQEPALKVVAGEICYKSTSDDQSYGMWCPVNYDTAHALEDGDRFYLHPPAPPAGMQLVPHKDMGNYKMMIAAGNRIEAEAIEVESGTIDGYSVIIDINYWHPFIEALEAARGES